MAELTCQDFVELVTEYLEGALDEDTVRRFEEHLALCPGCETYLSQMKETASRLGEIPVESLSAETQATLLSAFRDVEDQLSALRVLEQEATVTDRAVASAKRSTELSTLRYKRGLATYLEVLTAQTIELANERTAASLVTQRIVASAQLQLALGGGWDATQLPKN